MTYIAVDDEPFALEDIADALREAVPEVALHSFTSPGRALEYAESAPVDVAFLDIELGSMSGLVLAKKLKDLCPEIHIIFVTSHEQYAVKAFQLHATGYLMKPATAEDIRRELTFLYGESETRRRICVQTFGGFEVYVDGTALSFGRAKAKELLAYLVDRRGAGVTTREASRTSPSFCGPTWTPSRAAPPSLLSKSCPTRGTIWRWSSNGFRRGCRWFTTFAVKTSLCRR